MSFNLLLQRLNMILIHMRISHKMHKLSSLIPTLLFSTVKTKKPYQRNQLCKQSIRGDIKRHSQANITASLIQCTAELIISNIKLKKHMARRQCHFAKIFRIPRTDNHSSRIRVFLKHLNNLFQLIHTLARIILGIISVLCTVMSPLKPINRT